MKPLLLALTLLLSLTARADTFDPLLVFGSDGNAVTMSSTSINQITWTFAPREVVPDAALVFAFPIPPIDAVMSATLFVEGFNFTISTWEVDAFDACGDGPCDLWVLAGITLPRFYGTRAGWMSFTFGEERSPAYSFNLIEPVPEPATLVLVGTGLLAIASGLRRQHGKV